MTKHYDRLFSRQELADYLGESRRTLERDGPPYVRLGQRRIAYRWSDVEAWLASRTFKSRAAELARAAA